ncbi:MAG TPA: dual specificity protein phosphatase, partial [Ktedonobacterales bacterium]
EWCVVAGRPAERVRGEYVPHRLRFPGGRATLHGALAQLDALSPEDRARTLFGWGYARSAGQSVYHFASDTEDYGELRLEAGPAILEPRAGPITPVELTRHWTSPPPAHPRIVPQPMRLHQRFAGDPITIKLGSKIHRTRLFIGGIRQQDAQGRRPEVDAVLNLCHMPNIWLMDGVPAASDRWTCKGEGRGCMAPDELVAEAEWVAERLRAGRRVLVHCYAGLNRSATICCAALILLEGLSAEAALARVRERHPEAWPDPYYWLLLRWLARTTGSPERRLATLAEPALLAPGGTGLAR